MSKTKRNPADLLTVYRTHPAFAAMCRDAGRMLAAGADAAPVLRRIGERYGPPTEAVQQTLRERPQPLALVVPDLSDPAHSNRSAPPFGCRRQSVAC